MNSLPHQFAPLAASLVSDTASTSVPATPTSEAAQASAGQVTPISLDTRSVCKSTPAGTPSPVAKFVASLQDQDVDLVEATLLRFKEACGRGDQSVIEEALIEQATLLNAVGLKLLTNAGDANSLPQIKTCANLGLRSIDMARKSLETLISGRSRANRQTNVQVNVGVPPNELKSVPSE